MHMSIELSTLLDLDRRAVEQSVALADNVGNGDLVRPTPCSQWSLGDLLGHMAAQHRGFAASARGDGLDRTQWEVAAGDAADYRHAAAQALEAFAAIDDPGHPFLLPEFSTEQSLPASLAVSMHFVDYLVHAWDVARSMGLSFEPEQELVDAAWPIAQMVPDDESRLKPDSQFGPVFATADDASTWDRLLGALGRSPELKTDQV